MSKDAVDTAGAASRTGATQSPADAGDAGYSKGLKARHVNMIAIGGAIGTGLFLGAGGRLHDAGPALAVAYLVCGAFAFFVVRALGELVLYRPSSGSFVSYAREFLGEKGAYVAGWMYFLNWSTTGIADITAIALYTHYWSFFTDIPQWALALIALAVVLAVNLISVKIFGEMEFWFAIIKVATLVGFMLIGIFLLATQHEVGGHTPGPGLVTDHGGLLPHGMMPVVLVMQGVIFAYAALELVGVAAGETEEPEKVVPRAVNSIMWRVGVFYVGSVVLLALLLPGSVYTADQSPFVTVLSKIGVPAAGDVMNLVVLTAAMSSLNSGLYSTGRIPGARPRTVQRAQPAHQAGAVAVGDLARPAMGALGEEV
ncbi:amino acid permease, partial [Streptomyces halstedii]|uniref:amino acid permease n=1 Tax=Streptomyces halstedii TaxID=1944 RepID=UPI0033644687